MKTFRKDSELLSSSSYHHFTYVHNQTFVFICISLQLLLFEAERAWSYSRELSKLASTNEDKASVLKRNATTRFRRSIHWATQLLSHCQALHSSTPSKLSASDLTQATIYTLILNGRFLISRYDYDDGLIQLSVARSLLDELASRAITSRDQALATSFADEIGPEIRYCAHELGRSKAYDIDGIVKEVASQHKNDIVPGYGQLISKLTEENAGGAGGEEKKKLKPVMWEGEPVPIRNPELVDVLLKVQGADEKLKQAEREQSGKQTGEIKDGGKKGKIGKGTRSKKGVAAYDAILLALSDAEEVSRKLVEAQQVCYVSCYSSATKPLISMLMATVERNIKRTSWDTRHAIRTCLHHLSATLPPDST